MLRSDLSHKAHTNFQNFLFVRNVFFFSLLTSLSRKIEVHIESNFQFSVSIDVLNHFNATNIKKDCFRFVKKPTKYKLLDAI